MSRAVEESQGIEKYDYIVVNDDLDECTQALHNVIRAAHYAPGRNMSFISKIRNELVLEAKDRKGE